jgi:hypothetical protein
MISMRESITLVAHIHYFEGSIGVVVDYQLSYIIKIIILYQIVWLNEQKEAVESDHPRRLSVAISLVQRWENFPSQFVCGSEVCELIQSNGGRRLHGEGSAR